MPQIIEIRELSAPELIPYTNTSELKLRDMFLPEPGVFIAESPKVIRTALDSGFEPLSLLMERKYMTGQAADIIDRCGDIPVYTGDGSVLEQLTGFRLTQGVLCEMRRKELLPAENVLKRAERIAVLEDIMNQNNVGAIFRSAAALGMDAVLLTSGCSDPLFRRCVRVSMGSVFQLPWAYLPEGNWLDMLKGHGFTCAAMALRCDTVRIDDSRLRSAGKLAVVLGTEGTGLRQETIDGCDYTIKIPMSHGVDSLNVAAASAVAFWALGKNE
ncbi:MAG TPA: rRNA methyltransferase [Ruminococcus sp.]|nr:rRNA methyltransferase [Ruminococcus sp.]